MNKDYGKGIGLFALNAMAQSQLYNYDIKDDWNKLVKDLKKTINWEELTLEEAKELGFASWTSQESIDEDIAYQKKRLDDKEIDQETYNKKVKLLNNTLNLYLIPLYLVPIIPIGAKLTDIGGTDIVYDGNNIDLDIRFGKIAYGIKFNK